MWGVQWFLTFVSHDSLERAVKFSRLGNELVKVRNADLESNENRLGIVKHIFVAKNDC